MNIVFTPNSDIDSYIMKEEYIPIAVILNNEEYVKHIGFYYRDTDLCEFGVDPNTDEIVKFVLTLSKHYEFSSDQIVVPNSENGRIKLLYPCRIECSQFKTTVYANGVHISLSNTESVTHYKTGHLILSVDDNDNITNIYVERLTNGDIDFIKNELDLG